MILARGKYRLNAYHNTYHNTCQIHCTRNGMYCNTYQCISACIGMYCVGIWYVWNNDTCKYRPNICLCFSIRANTDANTFTNTRPIQSDTDRFKLEYRPIQAPIQTNTHIIVFNFCASTCQYRHWYCQITCPGQHHQHPLLPVCQRYLSLPSRLRTRQQDQPHPLDRQWFVIRQFLSVLLQQNFPRRREIPECLFGGMTLRDVLGRSISAASRNFLFKDCFGPEASHQGHKVRGCTYSSTQQKDALNVRSSIWT